MRYAAVLLFLVPAIAIAADHPELKPYPESVDGLERYVIVLPHKERGDDQNFRVEIFVGYEMETDGVNRVSISGEIQEKVIKGWGYNYYQTAKTGGPAASTLVGVPPGTPKVTKSVTMPSKLVRYNSRLPLVVYAPKGYEVRYRIWSAPKEQKAAEKG